MIDSDTQPCWRGNIDVSQLVEAFYEEGESTLTKFDVPNGLLEDVCFIPTNPRDLSPPFPPDIIPAAVAVLDLTEVPLWMFADSIWNLQTTSAETNQFFLRLLERSPLFLDIPLCIYSLLLTTAESNILITADPESTHFSLLARALHPPSLLTPSLSFKCEPPSPLQLQQFKSHQANPFQAPSPPPFAGQLISVLSPKRVIAREASCSQFDAKLESPSRVNAKSRRERRVQSLLPDIARRRKAELDNPFSNDCTRQNNARESSVGPSTLEVQTREVVKQTVIAALRLHSISSSDGDYKALINQCVGSTMFAIRGKLRAGKGVGMGEIGGIVEGLLKIFLN